MKTPTNIKSCTFIPKLNSLLVMLFDEIIFGPIHSRRLGISLGINVLPTQSKYCTFDCIYCECGWTHSDQKIRAKLYSREEIKNAMLERFPELIQKGIIPDSITFAGNGEPTIHPDFSGILDDVIELRNRFFPQARIAVLSNATLIHKPLVKETLLKIDDCILKLDAGSEEMFNRINRPSGKSKLADIIDELISFNGKLIIQTLLLRGEYNGEKIDNTSDFELDLWLGHLKKIRPQKVMIYCIDRATPARDLEKVSVEEMEAVAEKVRALGIKAEVFS
jgi:wyosine [tRNA(Phe)-imidazoG37] synthetase (radical SAM superfamily)